MTNPTSNRYFLISLDFELHWGSFDKHSLDPRKQYYLNTRHAIENILSLFQENQIHATWATVGLLLNGSKNELFSSLPETRPGYDNQTLSAYNYIENNQVGNDEAADPFHFGKSLIDKIRRTEGQEIGTHSFAHYYCNEAGQTVEEFSADLQAAVNVASGLGIELKSMVFPRNQFNSSYLEVCRENGITSVRSNPVDWWWHIDSTMNESFIKRFSRGADAYFPLGKKNSFPITGIDASNLPILIPASRLLRPYRKKELFLNSLKIKRIKKEMTRAARLGEVYHLWWHPHNFGNFTKENLQGLSEILQHYSLLKAEYDFQSLTMNELADLVLRESATKVDGRQ